MQVAKQFTIARSSVNITTGRSTIKQIAIQIFAYHWEQVALYIMVTGLMTLAIGSVLFVVLHLFQALAESATVQDVRFSNGLELFLLFSSPLPGRWQD